MKSLLTTKEILTNYFDGINDGGWEIWIADDIRFTNAGKTVPGKDAYVEALTRFLRVARSVDVKKMIIEGDDACVLASYPLRSPKGNTGVCDVAELLAVRGGKIRSSSIFFDTAAFQEFMAKG